VRERRRRAGASSAIVKLCDEVECVGTSDANHIMELVQEFVLALGFDEFELGFALPPPRSRQTRAEGPRP
jgi:hypothetical protein